MPRNVPSETSGGGQRRSEIADLAAENDGRERSADNVGRHDHPIATKHALDDPVGQTERERSQHAER
jgi:hypothetical protein